MDEERNSVTSQQNEEEQAGEDGVLMQTEQIKPKKPRRPLKVLRIQDLTDKTKGLRMLYDAMSERSQKLEAKAQLQPDKALKDYVSLIKEWAFNLAPKYEFGYMMERTQALGRKKEISEEMENLRLYHQGRLVYNSETQLYEPASSSHAGNAAIKSAKHRPAEAPKPPKKTVRLTADQGPVELGQPQAARNRPSEGVGNIPYTFAAMEPEETIFDNYADEEDLAYPIKKKPKTLEEQNKPDSSSKPMSPEKMSMEHFQTFGS